MILPGSRYESTVVFTAGPAVPAGLRRPRDIVPAPGVIEHTLATGDRADLLGRHYYNDPRRWWLILDANPDIACAADLEEGASGYVIQIAPGR